MACQALLYVLDGREGVIVEATSQLGGRPAAHSKPLLRSVWRLKRLDARYNDLRHEASHPLAVDIAFRILVGQKDGLVRAGGDEELSPFACRRILAQHNLLGAAAIFGDEHEASAA